jgi:hypothetical protein
MVRLLYFPVIHANTLLLRTDENQASIVKAFSTAKGLDKGRPQFAKDLAVHSMSDW